MHYTAVTVLCIFSQAHFMSCSVTGSGRSRVCLSEPPDFGQQHHSSLSDGGVEMSCTCLPKLTMLLPDPPHPSILPYWPFPEPPHPHPQWQPITCSFPGWRPWLFNPPSTYQGRPQRRPWPPMGVHHWGHGCLPQPKEVGVQENEQ